MDGSAIPVAALSAILGWQVATLLTRGRRGDGAFRLALAPGLGLGVSSVLWFSTLLAAGPRPVVFLAGEVALGVALALAIRRGRETPSGPVGPVAVEATAGSGPRWVVAALAASLVVGAAVAALAFRSHVEWAPHGGWDAWAIWDLRARFLSLAGDDWRIAFSDVVDWSHPDYPLLLPGSVAQFWTVAGRTSVAVPAGVAAAFTFGSVALLATGVALLRGPVEGLLAGLVLLAARGFVDHGATMYADVPLSFFMLATLLTLCLREVRRDRGWLVLAGVAASMAAWTKNEGVPFLILSGCVTPLTGVPGARRRSAGPDLAAFAAGAAPALACLVVFKSWLSPDNDLVAAAQSAGVWSRAGDLERHRQISGAFLAQAATCFGIRGGWFAWVALAAHAARAGLGAARPRGATAACTAVVAGAFGSYYVAYLASPHSLTWHIGSSIDRLFFQQAPAVILLLFLAAGSPPRAARPAPS